MTIAVGQPVARNLADAEVIDAAGNGHRLCSAWTTRDAVVVFVRHFACAGCAAHVAALLPRFDELATLDVGVAIVGCGSPGQLAAFVDREDLARPFGTFFTDSTLVSYRAAGFARSAWGTYGPIAIGQLVRARIQGHRNGRAQGDLLQQGGTLYVTRSGVIAFYHRETSLGDHARLGDVVDIALTQRAIEAAAT